MKKTILFAFILFSTQSIFAQFELGVRAGIGLTDNQVKSETAKFDLDNGEVKTNYHFGVYTSFKLNEKFTFNPEMIYSSKGNQSKIDDSKLHLKYINLPLLFGFNPTKKLKLLIGPDIGYLLDAEVKYSHSNRNVEHIYDNNFDLGIDLGIEYQLSKKIKLGLRYNQGFTSVIKDYTFQDAADRLIDDLRSKNRSFDFSVGFRIK